MSNEKKKKEDKFSSENKEDNKPKIGDSRPAPTSESGKTSSGNKQQQKNQKRERKRKNTRSSDSSKRKHVEGVGGHSPVDLDEGSLRHRRGRERRGKPIGRYLMCVSASEGVTQVAVLEGRSLIEHYVSHPANDWSEIHGNVYLGKVQNVLPGMEAAFVDIGTPKNAVLYRGDLLFDEQDLEQSSSLKNRRSAKSKSENNRASNEKSNCT